MGTRWAEATLTELQNCFSRIEALGLEFVGEKRKIQMHF